MSRATCADCDWTAEAPSMRDAIALLERHIQQDHNDPEF
ncbi:MAG: hypothetical protein RL134_644 [Actinomycetota bacterium]|jgi:predicted small metal-binding protein